VLGGKVIKGEQLLAILLQALRRFGIFGPVIEILSNVVDG
jgi:hypothetical protein